MELLAVLLFLGCLDISPLDGAKILLSVPMVPGMYSHVTAMAEVGQGLLYKGHDVSWLVPNTPYVPDKILSKPFKKVAVLYLNYYIHCIVFFQNARSILPMSFSMFESV